MATNMKLTLGSRGGAVRELQSRLNANGAHLAADGDFGEKTWTAVKRFQKEQGLVPDGAVGQSTWALLQGGVPSQASADAQAEYHRLRAQGPGTYDSPYGGALDELRSRLDDRQPFTYDLDGDLLYRQYRDQYTALGRRAMADTLGQSAALTGGYSNTYGQSAGQQAYDEYLQQLNSKVPELYKLAWDRYRAEGDALADRYDRMSRAEAEAYSRWRDTVGDHRADVDDAYRRWQDERQSDYQTWSDMVRLWQSEAEADRDERLQQEKLAYERERDAVADDHWERQFAADQAARAAAAAASTAKSSSRSSSAKSGSRSAKSGAKSAKSAAKSGDDLVHIPGYGYVTMADAEEMVAAGTISWVMRDNKRDHLTDEAGRYVARMRKPPVTHAFHQAQ